MDVPYTGGCQCGQVRYEIRAEPLTVYACHCKECQRQAASAFGMSMPVPRDAVILIQGKPKKWCRTSDSGREVACFFCSDCGTRLFHQPTRNPVIANIKPGTLDTTTELRAVGHLWTRSSQPWIQFSDATLNFEGQPTPEEYLQLIEKFSCQNNADN